MVIAAPVRTPRIVRVDLDTQEYLIALHAGALRQADNRFGNRKHKYEGDRRYSEQMHLSGVVAEACVAKHFNLFWLGGQRGGKDVAGCEVRAKMASEHRLILHPDDRDDAPYISVAVREGVGLIAGWIMGADGKQPKWWTDPKTGRPAYFVPNESLIPISELPHEFLQPNA
jgi:hypothetical protein